MDADFVNLARLAIEGRTGDIVSLVRQKASRLARKDPESADVLRKLVGAAGPVRRANPMPIPSDADSRLQLVRVSSMEESELASFVWPHPVKTAMDQVLEEWAHHDALAQAGLKPVGSMLFTGPPGIGKTAAAHLIAHRLGLPLFVLDLAAVMSSYLGKTGNNLRSVMKFAEQRQCVLLLDEFDSIAKRRDDQTDLGELKRLVTVLLQSIDAWPAGRLLIAATNHPELLDPAIWRRFDECIRFPQPNSSEIRQALKARLSSALSERWLNVLVCALEGRSFATVDQAARRLLKLSIVRPASLNEGIESLVEKYAADLEKEQQIDIGMKLVQLGFSNRQAARCTGTCHTTLGRRRRADG